MVSESMEKLQARGTAVTWFKGTYLDKPVVLPTIIVNDTSRQPDQLINNLMKNLKP